MRPIEPAELSAFLDGELPAGRAEEVRRALAADPVLRRAYEDLAALDAEWKARAAAVAVAPRASLGRALWGYRLRAAGALLGLVALRVALKIVPSAVAVPLEAVLLALAAGWGLYRFVRASEADRWRLLRQVALRGG
jgi:anti-sigma factor RsiW